jgi:hypothetical protein
MKQISLIIGFLFILFVGCDGKHSNADKAMPITQNNIKTYTDKMSQSSKSITEGEAEVSKLIKIYKAPLEDMGYDFDATILNSIKVLSKAQLTQVTVNAGKILSYVLHGIARNPDKVVADGFVTQDTKTKVLTYLNFREINPKTIMALHYVEKCQNDNDGICDIKKYTQILLDNNFVTPPSYIKDSNAFANLSIDTIFSNKINDLAFAFKNNFDKQVNYREFGKYLVYQDGTKVNANGFIESWRKPFKLKSEAKEKLKNYDPWWLE